MKVRYVGGIGPVEIAATGQEVGNGEVVEVPDDLGASLCEQASWEAVKIEKKEKSNG